MSVAKLSRQQKSELPDKSGEYMSAMGDFLYKKNQERLLQTTRLKMMPTLPMFQMALKRTAC